MTNRPKQIGTAAESAVCRFLQANGFPGAERRALRGGLDAGDITGCGPIVFEIKGGAAAKTASDGQVTAWLTETEVERRNANADIGILVMQRSGIGPLNAGRWWAVLQSWDLAALTMYDSQSYGALRLDTYTVRLHLADVVALLRDAGHGDPVRAA